MGISVRADNDSAHYQLLMTTSRQFALFRRSDGRRTTLIDWTSAPIVHDIGTSNVIRLAIFNNVLVVSLNGQALARVEDPEPIGAGGTYVWTTSGIEVVVRRMSVWRSTEDDVAPIGEPPLLFQDDLRNARQGWMKNPDWPTSNPMATTLMQPSSMAISSSRPGMLHISQTLRSNVSPRGDRRAKRVLRLGSTCPDPSTSGLSTSNRYKRLLCAGASRGGR